MLSPSTTIISDDQWIMTQFRIGHERAFEVIFNKYYGQLVYYAYRLVGDADVAKDMVSEAFLALWLRHENFYIQREAKAFLFQHTRFMSLHYLTRGKHKEKYIEYISTTNDEELKGSLDTAPQMLTEFSAHVHANLHLLSRRRRQVLTLFLAGFSTNDISYFLQLRPQTIRNTYIMAVEDMRDILANTDSAHAFDPY